MPGHTHTHTHIHTSIFIDIDSRRWSKSRNPVILIVIHYCQNLSYSTQKKCDRDCGNDQTSIRGRKHEPYMESPNKLPDTEKGTTGEEQSPEQLIIFYDIVALGPQLLLVC
jgi:hypothetical protein